MSGKGLRGDNHTISEDHDFWYVLKMLLERAGLGHFDDEASLFHLPAWIPYNTDSGDVHVFKMSPYRKHCVRFEVANGGSIDVHYHVSPRSVSYDLKFFVAHYYVLLGGTRFLYVRSRFRSQQHTATLRSVHAWTFHHVRILDCVSDHQCCGARTFQDRGQGYSSFGVFGSRFQAGQGRLVSGFCASQSAFHHLRRGGTFSHIVCHYTYFHHSSHEKRESAGDYSLGY